MHEINDLSALDSGKTKAAAMSSAPVAYQAGGRRIPAANPKCCGLQQLEELQRLESAAGGWTVGAYCEWLPATSYSGYGLP